MPGLSCGLQVIQLNDVIRYTAKRKTNLTGAPPLQGTNVTLYRHKNQFNDLLKVFSHTNVNFWEKILQISTMRKLNALLKASTDCEISFLSEKTYYKLFAKHKTKLTKRKITKLL